MPLFKRSTTNKSFTNWITTGANCSLVTTPRNAVIEEENAVAIKQKTKFMKQQSINSTQNSVRFAREAVGENIEKTGGTIRGCEKDWPMRSITWTSQRAILCERTMRQRRPKFNVAKYKEQAERDKDKTALDVQKTQERLGKVQTYGIGRMREVAESWQKDRFQFKGNTSNKEMDNELE
ncbi:hypothetical protein C8R43DRAFT_1104733 [Mycena crocata]|nr:hypothetical protein C8R43DRAFT_1104733 [Mycena crocata]